MNPNQNNNFFLNLLENVGILAKKAHPLTNILSTPQGQQYVSDIVNPIVNTAKLGMEQSPLGQMLTLPDQIQGGEQYAKEKSQEGLSSLMGLLGASYRMQPATPLIGALFGAIQGERKQAQNYLQGGEIDPMNILKASAQGMVEQPFAGEAVSDDPKVQQVVNLAVMLGMVGKGAYDTMKQKQQLARIKAEPGYEVKPAAPSPEGLTGTSIEEINKLKEMGYTDNEIVEMTRQTVGSTKPQGALGLVGDKDVTKGRLSDVKLNKGEVIMYHRTTPENAKRIMETGKFNVGKENTGEVFLSNMENGQAVGYGEAVVPVKVKKSQLRLDDEFPSGEQHFAISSKDAIPIKPNVPQPPVSDVKRIKK